MFAVALFPNIWPVLVIWALVYLADYYITIYSAGLFQGPIREHMRFEGSYELTPAFVKDVNALRRLSPNFLVRWLASLPLLYLVWWMSYPLLGLTGFFDFLMGGLFLREAVVLLRHLRNLALIRFARDGGLVGQVVQARWLSLKLSAAELTSFGVLFLALAAALESWFFLGGGVTCLFTGTQHWMYARKAQPVKAEVSG